VKVLRIGLAQINPTVGDLEGNLDKLKTYLREARERGVDLLCFPELAITGYPPEDLLLKPAFIRDNLAALEDFARSTKDSDVAVVVGFVDQRDDLYNAAAVIYRGEVKGVHHKVFLPNYGVFDEERYFKAGDLCQVFLIKGVRVGITICEDLWYPLGPAIAQILGGAELIVNISASPYHAGKRAFRERMFSVRASDGVTPVAYVNMVGGQDELVFDGYSALFD